MSRQDQALRRLAAGVLLPGFIGTAPPPWLVAAIEDGLAGVVYFAPNIAPNIAPSTDSAGQLAGLSGRLHGLRDGVLIAVDEEGGDVTRLRAATGSQVPGNAALGVVDDIALTGAVASAIGGELRRAGIDIDLAPCVDVNCDPANPVIGVRSFGAGPALVARHGAAAVSGLQAAGVAACAKHFPGHGDTRLDSHLALPAVHADAATLWARELVPFGAAVAAGVRCVLTAHVLVPALDPALPATLSPALLRLLRTDLGFDGVVLTDAMDMIAIAGTAGTAGVAAGAVAALAAGVDLVCLGNPANDGARGDGRAELLLVWQAVVDAVRSGELPVPRLEQAAARVHALSQWCRAAASIPAPEPATAVAAPLADAWASHASSAEGRDAHASPLGPEARLDVGLVAARRAVHSTGQVRLTTRPELVDLRRHLNRAAGRTSAALPDELLRRAPGGSLSAVAGGDLGPAGTPDPSGITGVSGQPGFSGGQPGVSGGQPGVSGGQPGVSGGLPGVSGGLPGVSVGSPDPRRGLVILVDEPQRDPAVLAELRSLLAGRPDAVVVATGWPDPTIDLGTNVIRTFGNGRVNAAAAAEVLFGPAAADTRMPVPGGTGS